MKKMHVLPLLILLFTVPFLWANGGADTDSAAGELTILNWVSGNEGDAIDEIDKAFMAK